jgi:hypothetical protein
LCVSSSGSTIKRLGQFVQLDLVRVRLRGIRPRVAHQSLQCNKVLRHFIRAGGEPMIREPWPGPEQSLALILRLARPRGSQSEPDAIG